MSPHPPIPPSPHRLLSPAVLWPLAVLACLFAFVATHPIRPHDFWWHLAVGREIVQTGHIPQVDHYSYTMPGRPYPSYNVYWLADVALYRVYALGGPALSVFAHTLLIVGTYLLLFLLCRRIAGDARLATVALLVALVLGFENWNLRPQAITFLLFTLNLWLIVRFRMDARVPRWLVLGFPVLMLVWVNCHGSFPLGIVMQGLWALETVWERWRIGSRSQREVWVPCVAVLLSAGATLLNPQGVGIFGYLRAMGANPVVQQLPEWAPASLATADGLAFFMLGALGLGLLLWAGRDRSGLFHWLMLGSFGLLAWHTGRAIVWFGLVLAPIAAELLARVLRRTPAAPAQLSSRGERVTLGLIVAGFVALMLVTLPWFKGHLPLPPRKAGLISQETPVAATDFLLRSQLPPRVFHYDAYGSYLIWAAAPRYQVFADPRIELYPEGVWSLYHRVSRGDAGWEEGLGLCGVNTLLLSRADQPGLLAAAQRSPRWRQVYEDNVAVVLVRREPL